MTARTAVTLGALLAGLGVALGAFGAHALRPRLDPRDLEIYETAVRYQIYHALALLASAWLIDRGIQQAGHAALAFTIGVVIFSGSLYLLVGTGQRWLGAITPLGGVAFLSGWVLLALAAQKV